MASIFPRKNKDGSTTWRVMIRRVGMKSFITSFANKDEAEKFIKENERKYVLNPEIFSFNQLQRIRQNEFERKIIHESHN